MGSIGGAVVYGTYIFMFGCNVFVYVFSVVLYPVNLQICIFSENGGTLLK